MIGPGGSVWFNNDPSENPFVKAGYTQTLHSPGCKLVGGDEWRPLLDYDLVDQDFVTECKHPSHATVHSMFKVWCDESYEETKPEEGKLV